MECEGGVKRAQVSLNDFNMKSFMCFMLKSFETHETMETKSPCPAEVLMEYARGLIVRLFKVIIEIA